MAKKFRKYVALTEGKYTLILNFLGVYNEFTFMTAQEGDIKGIASLSFEGSTVRVGNVFVPINLDYYKVPSNLSFLLESKNKEVDFALVSNLYEQALKEIKMEV